MYNNTGVLPRAEYVTPCALHKAVKNRILEEAIHALWKMTNQLELVFTSPDRYKAILRAMGPIISLISTIASTTVDI